MPRSFERRYIEVNAAGMSLRYVEDGKEILSSRVIVGRPVSPTPIFRSAVNAVTANPPWNVPARIASREILPKLKQNPNYLASEDMILLNGPPGDPNGMSVNWRRYTAANFPYRIRQLPGEKNALGVLKLEMPNRFSVFLHDTPGKAAFERDTRALSHGCIRVQQIGALAELALGTDRQEAAQWIADAIASGKTQSLVLNEPLPVYVLYWTVIAEADGTVGFRHDLYGRDRRLIAALANRRNIRRSAFEACERESVTG
jgi:L,D-transpeptidase YcbB